MRLLISVLLLLSSALPVLAGHPFGQPFTLGPGESILLGADELHVGFDGILSDSRCPEGVLCFWEGDAAADLWVQILNQDVQGFVLHTASAEPNSLNLGNYMIAMTLVAPAAVVDVPIDPADYLVTLVVYAAEVSFSVYSWSAVKARYR